MQTNRTIIRIRQSSARTFRACEMKYHLRDAGLYPLAKSPALSIGTAVHAGRATFLRNLPILDTSSAIAACEASMLAEVSQFPSLRVREATLGVDGKTHLAYCKCYACSWATAVATTIDYCEGFATRYAVDDFVVHSVEQQFELVVAEYEELQLVYTGTSDADVNFGKQRVNFELKTTSRELTEFMDSEEMSAQHCVYPYALQQLTGEPFYGTLLDCIRKPTKTQGSAASHRLIPKTRHDYDIFQKDSLELLKRLAYHIENDYWPKNTDSCRTVYGRCEYWDLCFSNFARYAMQKYGVVETPLVEETNGD